MSKKDFFISYTATNKDWAEWIAWYLEENNYSTIFQAWDFRPGNNFVNEMQKATIRAERTIAVLSPEYMNSGFTQSEWNAAFAQDPTGKGRKLLTIRINNFELEGLLSQVVYIDLVGLSEEEAVKELINGVSTDERLKPISPPRFPGAQQHHSNKKPVFPNTGSTNNPFEEGAIPNLKRTTNNDEISVYKEKRLCFFNLKGGVGRTFLTSLFAAYYLSVNKKVLIIDGDINNGNSRTFFDGNKVNELRRNITFEKINDYKNYILTEGKLNILISEKLIQHDQFAFVKKANDFINVSKYDVVLIDCPRQYDYYKYLLMLSDKVLIPVIPGTFEYDSIEKSHNELMKLNDDFYNHFKDLGFETPKIIGVINNNIKYKQKFDVKFLNDIWDNYTDYRVTTVIEKFENIGARASEIKYLTTKYKNSKLYIQTKAIVNEVESKLYNT